MPKIFVVNTYVTTNDTRKYDDFFKDILSKYVSEGFEVEVGGLSFGSYSLEDYYDEVLNSPYILERVKKSEDEGYDAVVINCFADPALEAAREIVKIPVVGVGEAAMNIACLLGNRLSILFVGRPAVTRKHLSAFKRRIANEKWASMRSIGLTVLDIDSRKEEAATLLLQEGRKAVEEDKADVLVLGCTGLTGFASKLQEELDVPVVEPSIAGVKVAEILLTMGLSHSKVLYERPAKKPRIYPDSLHLLRDLVEKQI
jgi:allantoin racemase